MITTAIMKLLATTAAYSYKKRDVTAYHDASRARRDVGCMITTAIMKLLATTAA